MLISLWFQVMFTTLITYHSCMCVIPRDSGLSDHGILLPTWLHLYQSKENIKEYSRISTLEQKHFIFLHAQSHIHCSLQLYPLQAGCRKPNKTNPMEPVYPISTNGELFPWAQLRLPQSIKPLSYDLTLNPDLDKMTFTGRTVINMSILHSTNRIVFHGANINITKATFKVGLKRIFCVLMNKLFTFFFVC